MTLPVGKKSSLFSAIRSQKFQEHGNKNFPPRISSKRTRTSLPRDKINVALAKTISTRNMTREKANKRQCDSVPHEHMNPSKKEFW